MTTLSLPSYVTAADQHNVANGGVSWTDPQSWERKLGSVGKFISASMMSGVNSFYNTGATVGRWTGMTDTPDRDTATWITSYDTDLGRYYRANKEATDLTGFVLGALVPGPGGTKVFNAGQVALKTAIDTGRIGGMTARAAGLLVTRTDDYIEAAATAINESTTAVKLLNANTVRAIGSGFYQNTLEAAAFEIAVISTMFKAPTLENADAGDIAKNILFGGVIGGSIASAFTTAKTFGALRRRVQVEDPIRAGFLARPQFASATSDSDKIVMLGYDIEYGGAVPIALRAADGTIIPPRQVDVTLFNDRLTKNFNDIRAATLQLSGGDSLVGNLVADFSVPIRRDGKYVAGGADAYLQNYHNATRILRANEESPLEAIQRKVTKAGGVVETPVAARYVTLFGESAGQVSDTAPRFPALADVYRTVDQLKDYVRSLKFGKELPDVSTWSAAKIPGVRSVREAQARYIWALSPESGGTLKEVRRGLVVDKYDIPVLERAYFDGVYDIRVSTGDGPTLEVRPVGSKEEMLRVIKEAKLEAAMFLGQQFARQSRKDAQGTAEAIAKIVNVKTSYLQGGRSTNELDDLFANQSDLLAFREARKARGLSSTTPGADTHTLFLPRVAKIVYKTDESLEAVSPHVVDAMVYFKAQQKVFQEGADRVTASVLGDAAEQLPKLSDRDLESAFRTGSGPGLLTSENSNYGTLGSAMAFVGTVTREIKQQFRKRTSEAMEASLVKLGSNREAAIEFETINQRVTRSPEQFVLREDTLGNQVLVSKQAITETVDGQQVVADIADFELLEEGVNAFTIRNEETVEAIRNHIQVTGQRTGKLREIRAQQGNTDYKDSEVYRPIRPNLRDYPHFAFVVDDSVSGPGAGHVTMLHAASERELEALADRVPAGYTVRFKSQVEDFKRAAGQFEFSRTLNENYINSDLAKNGVFSNFFTKTDPQKIIDDIQQQHFQESDMMVLEAVRMKYETTFSHLEDFGKQYAKAATSRLASRAETIEKTSDNPFFNYIKTALDISKINEQPLVYGFNKLLDDNVSRAYAGISREWNKAKTPEELAAVNSAMDKYGMQTAFYDADLNSLVNHTAPRGVLTRFVRGANALLSRFVLGLDPLNALNNAIGSNILRTTELRHIYKAIEAGDQTIAGELSQLAKIKLPGTGDEILSPSKLMAKAVKNFWEDRAADGAANGPLMQKYRDMGLVKDRAEQLKMLVDDFTLTGTETVEQLNTRMKTAFARAKQLGEDAGEVGEKLTGNKLAEEFNRFISANVMDQLTDLAVKRGLMDDATARTYINTFVNRVEGNIVASQRPLIFQGPIGQAISLFQSYQFNLLQQLFRYVSEGSKKDLATLAGLQSTLYGIQSMPAFQFINVHLIGQMSGNTEHKDTYDAVYGAAGKTAGDFILYGLPSNLLFGWGQGGGVNIYSRGDINPRHLTILPTTLQELPIVAGWGKLFLSIADTTKRISGGGDVWESLLQGVEHNGISRPLAGIAQTLQSIDNNGVAYSTSSRGTILYQNDLMSWATVGRMAGGRPLDEAVTNDALFRIKSYEATNRKRLLSLGENLKTTVIQGNEPSEEQVMQFAQRYTELGGKQKNFNKWMMELYKSANEPQAEKIRQSLTNPYAYKLQLLQGGDDAEDTPTQ